MTDATLSLILPAFIIVAVLVAGIIAAVSGLPDVRTRRFAAKTVAHYGEIVKGFVNVGFDGIYTATYTVCYAGSIRRVWFDLVRTKSGNHIVSKINIKELC